MTADTNSFIRMVKHPVKFRMFLFFKLPNGFFAGLRIKEMDEHHCVVTIPYKWFNKNPFRSTYFASLSMAAEMSTGALGFCHLYKRNPPVSMLVVKVESEYFKKAIDQTTFICEDGDLIRKAIEDCVMEAEAKSVRAKSIGKNRAGEVVAEFYVTWSFKAKTKKTES